ncbi:MAG TPA: carbonic anhydrase [Gemmatimonadales bacterium]|nr:carbonic anhydrase [Gemmatimonadales bacterium]
MSVIDDVQQANRRFAEGFRLGHLPLPPAKKLAIVACMDARLTVEPALGLKTGDAHIIRNAGGIVTDDVIRSLLISHYLLGTEEWMIVNHTDCGMLTFKDEELVAKLRAEWDTTAVTPAHFHAFSDLEENVRHQIQKLQSHPWVPNDIPVRGFIYDVRSGTLNEVAEAVSPAIR